jgi:hypothetical protein
MNDQNTLIELKLPLHAVNVLMAGLGKLPLEQAIDVLMAVRSQAEPQLKAAADAEPAEQ